jgi:hypothetical protein
MASDPDGMLRLLRCTATGVSQASEARAELAARNTPHAEDHDEQSHSLDPGSTPPFLARQNAPAAPRHDHLSARHLDSQTT